MKMDHLIDVIDKYDEILDLNTLRVEVAKDARAFSSPEDLKTELGNFIKNFDWFLKYSDWTTRPSSLYAFSPSLCGRDPFDFILQIVSKFRPKSEEIPLWMIVQ